MGASSLSNAFKRSRSPTNNIDAHIEAMVGKEVDLSRSQKTLIGTRINPKSVLLEAAKRDSEFSSDGRRTVNNIINTTS